MTAMPIVMHVNGPAGAGFRCALRLRKTSARR
jgi:hypothetical protein